MWRAAMKPNAMIAKAAEAEIKRRIQRGELLLPDQVHENLMENLDIWTKMMTVAVNRGLGIGKKRFEEKVQPLLNDITEDFFNNVKDADEEYARAVVERMYEQVMGD